MYWIGRKSIKFILFIYFTMLGATDHQHLWDLGLKIKHAKKPSLKPQKPKAGDYKNVASAPQKLSIAPMHLQNNPVEEFMQNGTTVDPNQFLLSLEPKTTATVFEIGKNKILSNQIEQAKELFYYLLTSDRISEGNREQTKFYYAYSQFLDGNHFQAFKILESIETKSEKEIFLKAQALEKLNRKEDAINCYFEIIENFSNSEYYNMARIKIGILE